MLSTILSPYEFEFIKENIRGKEVSKKIASRPLAWHNNENLIKVVPDKINLKEILRESGSRHKIISQSNFAPVDGNPNKVRMQFRCQTNNTTQVGIEQKTNMKEKLLLKK